MKKFTNSCRFCVFLLFILTGLTITLTNAQTCPNFDYDLDQARNGDEDSTVNPMVWVNGNLNASQAHFVEGYSVPYRVILKGLTAGTCFCIRIEYDIRHSGVNALDYLTSFPNCTNTLNDNPSHQGSFMHDPECVDPLAGTTFISPVVNYFPIPVPTQNAPAVGSLLQPMTSFNAHAEGNTDFTIYDGVINSAVYFQEGDLTDSQSETSIDICFTANNDSVIIAWGGHIASRIEWGIGNSAGAISGSPYHMRILGMKCCNQVTFTGGNQDRSLQAAAVIPAPVSLITGIDSSCAGSTNTHTLTTDQPGTTTYQWELVDPGTTGAQITGSDTAQVVEISTSAPGEYIICGTATVNGAEGSDCDTITVLGNPVCDITGDSIACNGETVTFTASAGASYLWNTGETTQSIQVSNAGNYTVTVTNSSGCSCSFTKALIASTPFSLELVTDSVECYGDNTGGVNLNVTGGDGSLLYSWSNGSTTEDISGVDAGTYTVTVTDPNGCSQTASAEVFQPADSLNVTALPQHVSCADGSDGSIDITVTGGTQPYSYAWSNGSTVEDPSGLPSGAYNVVVTDANGCTDGIEVLVDEPTAILIGEEHENVACNGGNTGSIDITISGGTPNYSVLWNDGATTEDRTGLTANTYTIVVTDANGCSDSLSIIISQAGTLETSETHENVSCYGGNNGSIDLTVSGGTPDYTYLWNDNITSEDRTNLTAGIYTITVTDFNGCSAAEIIEITQPDSVEISEQHGNVSCFGGSDGFINATINGGTLPYDYDWNNGLSTDEDLTNISQGIYTLVVTDFNGCSATIEVEISEPSALLITDSILTHVSCFEGSNGAIDITVSGGTTDYDFNWSNGATTEDISGLVAGVYTVDITDANGCSVQGTYLINEPTLLEVSETHENLTCFESDNGSVDLTITGGTPLYGILWSNGATSEDLSALEPATYTVTVTDANGCTAGLSVTITEPGDLSLMEQHENESCNENNDGSINLGVSGGTPDYEYDWSNGETTQDITGLSAGNYTVTVTDANGCSKQLTVEITQPDVLALSAVIDSVNCSQGPDGAIDLTVSGGTPVYGYEWSNSATTEDISGLAAGTYTVTVTDANGCSASASYDVAQPDGLVLSAVIDSVNCNGHSDGAIDLTVTGGTPGYLYLWNTGITTQDITGLAAGSYTVTVTDANGCISTATYNVEEPTAIEISLIASPVSCNLGSNGSVDLTVSGGTGAYTFSWSNSATTEDLIGVAAGIYTVTVTDENGCSVTVSSEVTEPSAIILEVTGACSTCKKPGDAYASANASGGTGILTYNWSNGQTTATISGLESGTYIVTVTDENGCTAIGSILLDCEPKCQYTTFTQGGWGSDPQGNNPGTYLHANFGNAYPSGITLGCTNTLTFTSAQAITDYLPAGTTAGQLPAGAMVDPAGSYNNILASQLLAASLNVGFDSYDPNFSSETGELKDLEIASGTFAGWTVAQLLDSANSYIGGCGSLYSASSFNSALSSINETFDNGTVNEGYLLCPSEELIIHVCATNTVCGINGAINITVTGGEAPYLYNWSNGATTEDLSGLLPGTYTVTVSDAAGCVTQISQLIAGPKALKIRKKGITHASDYVCDGAIDIKAAFGTKPYSYQWSNGATTEDINGLCVGYYKVTVTDAAGCTAKRRFRVQYLKDVNPVRIENNNTVENDISIINVYPSPVSDYATIQLQFATSGEATIMIYDIMGKMVASFENIPANKGVTEEIELDVTNLQSGSYMFRVFKDGNQATGKLQVIR